MKREDLKIKSMLADVPESKSFMLNDGQAIKNLSELKEAIEQMSEETFRYYVSKGKNDFANWVRDVVRDEQLAAALPRTTSKAESVIEIAKEIKRLESISTANWCPIFRPPVWPF
jgi:hypothetical protein